MDNQTKLNKAGTIIYADKNARSILLDKKFKVYYQPCPIESIYKGQYSCWKDFMKRADYLFRRDIFPSLKFEIVEE